ncbi:aminotransferase class I/II-fold pyridoxal phosphate-dependent enzyme [Winogradskyella echinorum]|uniref:Aminotransferase class I/II-fold pyridoxal phosphate-dependent enzyme n=1 Tax=Winogradskyella echinorum TaxID=538189 RepID=A0ABR6Y1Z4_9FLAO|nr:aminotransferase class I/II-fold pyridoxal phosphate-dependent enzyme [Winogradskyella echinorum]MBC3846679.1 aminotransferase class I/II-fold pyridoxal phosphate-dependent enzyme [Winogradskyella echinorum]MBC5751027.1 aminotransferase class I/II-fold pyridoxal phosphate-dependent enzyme [Winogradskyella echinorum]
MTNKKMGINTICTHIGEIKDEQFKGAVSPMYLSSSYEFLDVDVKRYPRYFNTPNQEYLSKKIAALERTESALIFSSGMAAISHMFLAFLQKGDHLVVQNTLYGGTVNFIKEEFPKYGIEYTFTNGYKVEDFEAAIQPNTKLIHIETPSNPLLTITDIKAISKLGKAKNILTSIDNTFASPVNQNPIDLGVDMVMHSATKYFGGHSDICAGAVAGSEEIIERIWNVGKNLGGSLSDMTVWMLERSMKTLGLRVKTQTKNAMKMAKWLNKHSQISKVYYPGLKSHPEYKLAKSQMTGFGAMLSFELKDDLDALEFQKQLKLIKSSMSLAGVESTMISPHLTSHALLTQEERDKVGISNQLVRFSVGIEDVKDLKSDIDQAINKISKK